MYRLLIVALSLVLLSCASQTPMPESGTTALQAKSGLTQSFDGPTIWGQNDCSHRKLPFISIEENEILLTNAGKEIQHHFVYVACTSPNYQAIKATLKREIYPLGSLGKRGKPVFSDTTQNFRINPGQWNVNAVVIPDPKLKPGNYDFVLTLSSPPTMVKKNRPFVIQK